MIVVPGKKGGETKKIKNWEFATHTAHCIRKKKFGAPAEGVGTKKKAWCLLVGYPLPKLTGYAAVELGIIGLTKTTIVGADRYVLVLLTYIKG